MHGLRDHGQDHAVANKDDFGKHLGAQAGKNHAPLHDVGKGDAPKHVPNVKDVHHTSIPAPKNTKNPLPTPKPKGKG